MISGSTTSWEVSAARNDISPEIRASLVVQGDGDRRGRRDAAEQGRRGGDGVVAAVVDLVESQPAVPVAGQQVRREHRRQDHREAAQRPERQGHLVAEAQGGADHQELGADDVPAALAARPPGTVPRRSPAPASRRTTWPAGSGWRGALRRGRAATRTAASRSRTYRLLWRLLAYASWCRERVQHVDQLTHARLEPMLVAISISPSGRPRWTGRRPRSAREADGGVSQVVADIVRVIRESGLPNETNAMFTNIEGEWDEVMAVVKQAVDVAAASYPRVGPGAQGRHPPGVRRAADGQGRAGRGAPA